MAGTFSGELFGLSCVCCIVIALMCLCSGFPGQPTPEPHVLLRHSRFRLKALHHLLAGAGLSMPCWLAHWLAICSQLRFSQELGSLPAWRDAAHQCHRLVLFGSCLSSQLVCCSASSWRAPLLRS